MSESQVGKSRTDTLPQILKSDKACNSKENIKPTHRALGKDDQKKENANPLNLCFYDSSISKDKWGNQIRVTLVKKTGVLKKNKSTYKTDRFELQG